MSVKNNSKIASKPPKGAVKKIIGVWRLGI
jgi:hypothetical protein